MAVPKMSGVDSDLSGFWLLFSYSYKMIREEYALGVTSGIL